MRSSKRSGEALKEAPGLLEQAIAVRGQADQQQPCDEHERGPGLFCGSAQMDPRKPATLTQRAKPPMTARGYLWLAPRGHTDVASFSPASWRAEAYFFLATNGLLLAVQK